MEDPDGVHTRVHEILSSIGNSIKRENFSLTLDPNRVRKNGLLSEFYTGTTLNKDSGEITHVAIKVVPNHDMNSYQTIYKNEIHFYSEIFPELDKYQKKKGVRNLFKNLPRYLAGHLMTSKEFLIMENLKPAGYEILENASCLRSEYLETVFQMYARFHALSFVYKHEHPKEFNDLTIELVDVMKCMENTNVGMSIEKSYDAAIEAFDIEHETDIISRLRKVEDVRKTLANSRSFPGNYTCLIHGDCWLHNMLFKHKDSGELENVKLIDFQLVFVSTPVHDLSYFFYSGAEKADIDKLDYYLKLYYQSFSSFVTELGADPQKIYPFAALKEDWKKYSLVGLIIGIGMWVGKLLDKDDIMSMEKRKGLPREKYYQLWNEKLAEVRKRNTFRQRARDICLHAVEYGIL